MVEGTECGNRPGPPATGIRVSYLFVRCAEVVSGFGVLIRGLGLVASNHVGQFAVILQRLGKHAVEMTGEINQNHFVIFKHG